MAGCQRQEPPPNTPIYSTDAEYEQALAEAVELSDEALMEYAEEQELDPEEEARLEEALTLTNGLVYYNPESFGPYVIRGKIHHALGNLEQAKEDLEFAISELPETPDTARVWTKAETYNELSMVEFKLENYEAAEQASEEAIRRYLDNPNYRAQMASVLIQQGRLDEAEGHIREALLSDPEHKEANRLANFIQMIRDE